MALCFRLIAFCPLGCPPLQGLIKVERINGFPVSSEAAEVGSKQVCDLLRNSSLDDCMAQSSRSSRGRGISPGLKMEKGGV